MTAIVNINLLSLVAVVIAVTTSAGPKAELEPFKRMCLSPLLGEGSAEDQLEAAFEDDVHAGL